MRRDAANPTRRAHGRSAARRRRRWWWRQGAAICTVAAVCCIAVAPAIGNERDPLQRARDRIAVALDQTQVPQRDAHLRAAAEHYHAALNDPALSPRDARHARRALRAIDALLAPLPHLPPPLPPPAETAVAVPEPPAPSAMALPSSPPDHEPRAAAPASAEQADLPPPDPTPAGASEFAGLVLPDHVDPAGTLAVALAALRCEPHAAEPLRHRLRAGRRLDGRFGPGLVPPSAGVDALHTLVAVTALSQPDVSALPAEHADTLLRTLLLEQSRRGGWRDPLAEVPASPVAEPTDQLFATAANLALIRKLAVHPDLAPVLQTDLTAARLDAERRLAELRAAAPPPDPDRPATFTDAVLERLLRP